MKKTLLSATLLLTLIIANVQETPKGLPVNATAPDFTAKDQNGAKVNLKEKLEKGSVVLVFYRGQWCPYCNRQLKKLEDSLSFITSKGATLITVTPEKPENISKTIEKTRATYPILFDNGLRIMKSYDVAYAVSEKTIQQYKGYGIDFTEANGTDNGAHLPIPAVFVINKQGKIVFRHFDPDYTKRASVADILAHL
jgi:peroxiredoxin